jgi:hypothetical protein
VIRNRRNRGSCQHTQKAGYAYPVDFRAFEATRTDLRLRRRRPGQRCRDHDRHSLGCSLLPDERRINCGLICCAFREKLFNDEKPLTTGATLLESVHRMRWPSTTVRGLYNCAVRCGRRFFSWACVPAIQLQKHNPEAAIQSLEGARPYDTNFFMGLSPAYYRGLAYLQDQQWHEASNEFQRVIDHRAIDPDSLYIALSQLEPGHAFQLSADRPNAVRGYSEAERVWKRQTPAFLLFKSFVFISSN